MHSHFWMPCQQSLEYIDCLSCRPSSQKKECHEYEKRKISYFVLARNFNSTLNFTQSGWHILFSPDLHFQLAKRCERQNTPSSAWDGDQVLPLQVSPNLCNILTWPAGVNVVDVVDRYIDKTGVITEMSSCPQVLCIRRCWHNYIRSRIISTRWLPKCHHAHSCCEYSGCWK